MKTVVITGATSGIGKATAMALARNRATIIALGRNEQKGKQLMAALKKSGASEVAFVRVDMTSLAEVRQAALQVSQHCKCIDVLVNNAGARHQKFQLSPDGFELTFAVNHLGPFLLSALLLERVLDSSQGRILTLSSGAHGSARMAPRAHWLSDDYDYRQAYASSKLANLFFAYELADRLKTTSATSNAIDPGGIASRFALNNGLKSWLKHIVSHAVRGELRRPASAAGEIARLATAPEWERANGEYFVKGRIAKSSERSYNKQESKALWESSLQYCDLEESVGPIWQILRPNRY
jgi:NAD(P)-dependent dehydrogenase (short-subunit alcohol dehydrogenase family)